MRPDKISRDQSYRGKYSISETGCCCIKRFPFDLYTDLEIKAASDPTPGLEGGEEEGRVR